MSIEIKSTCAGSPLWLYASRREPVVVQTRHSGASVSRAEFLAAVAQECGVIIIDKSELPEVTLDRGGYLVDGERFYQDTDRAALARKWALRDLALAEYLDAHPPIDEADVEALTAILADADLASGGWANVARHALSTGRIEVKK